MKRVILLLVSVLCMMAAGAQNTRLSPRAAMLLGELSDKYSIDDLNRRYTFVESQGTFCVHAFAILSEGTDAKSLAVMGVRMGALTGNMTTVLIPVERYADFVASGFCSWLDLGREVRPLLDKARADIGVDYIHQGIGLPQGYDGSGVVVGVIDVGFEYGHPSFYDTTGTVLRIKRVWQQIDVTGTAPAGFAYGSEYSTTPEILAAVTDRPNSGHGSHVAGIAAGCGGSDSIGRRYSGMAPAADIVMVASNMEEVGIMDGIRYIHQYARSVGKPCVINISLGSVEGPHDGLGSLDVDIANYLHATPLDSIVVVVSAGNNGSSRNHLHKQFTATDTMLRTYCYDYVSGDYAAAVDCWGDSGSAFSVSVALVNDNFQSVSEIMATPFVQSDVDSVYIFQLTSERDSVYTCEISVSHINPLNDRPNIYVYIHKDGARYSSDIFSIAVKSTSADVHMWSSKYEFVSLGYDSYSQGNDEYTISGVGGNTDAVITVGSYATRTRRMSESGNTHTVSSNEDGDISDFTSRGPTLDGRVKPDICAPGEVLVSSINTPYIPSYGQNYVFDSTVFGGQIYYYCLMQGTSMSSPAAAGIVALWLQRNPRLNVDSVRAILHSSNRRDRFTGELPATGSNTWGWGKIDAFGGLPVTTEPMYQLDVTENNFLYGYVAGGGRHPQGQHVIEAVPASGYVFVGWDDGDMSNPRVVNLMSDTLLGANFEFSTCDTIREFPWTAEFVESALTCWDMNMITALVPWSFVSSMMVSISSNGSVDNWLLTPYIVAAANTSLVYRILSRDHDSVAIKAITENDTLLLADEYITSTTGWERYVDLTPLDGQLIRLAFHHHSSTPSGYVALARAKIDYLNGIDNVGDLTYYVGTEGRRIIVRGAEGVNVNVYDVMGRMVGSLPATGIGNREVTVPAAGVYMIRVGDLPVRKVVVVR